MIKEVIVVEGRDDITAVKRAIDAEMIATGGFGINKKVIDRIKEAQKRKGVIVLTDPDFAGEKIRSIISKRVPGIKHAYISRAEGTKGDNISDLVYFKLSGDSKAKIRRELIGKELRIGYGNANQMLSRLNNYGISKEEFIKAKEKIENMI